MMGGSSSSVSPRGSETLTLRKIQRKSHKRVKVNTEDMLQSTHLQSNRSSLLLSAASDTSKWQMVVDDPSLLHIRVVSYDVNIAVQ